jgi:hypothetical protein
MGAAAGYRRTIQSTATTTPEVVGALIGEPLQVLVGISGAGQIGGDWSPAELATNDTIICFNRLSFLATP